MSFKSKQLILLLLFALSSVAVYQGFYADSSDSEYEPFTKGYALTDVVMQSTDDNGQIVTSMQAPSMVHYLDNEQTIIEQPVVRLFTDENTWLLNSPKAIYQRNKQNLFFPDQVKVSSEQAPKVTIESSQLTVDLTSKKGSTPAMIAMQQPGGSLRGVGALILFTTKQIEILNNVYAEFEPY
ncbi:LPS export ABC transporter periplasmic protein LptC [Marinicella gelatinilytica]|uniref:LPS export ABC transporter periplasmic protein LptC n=1 Tax=Marinicella gelatinilytica TaxID=2996017 RepID=UPI002260BB70|nr:LPS export ABC transporter periplasmic protein LptC [Marinicella gelatinilytica]MCX7544600.1 LPS export ABC transporter periplasmic protein LptC [Marinicella gelatinilytica]